MVKDVNNAVITQRKQQRWVLKNQGRKIYPGHSWIKINTDLAASLGACLYKKGNSLPLKYAKASDTTRTEYLLILITENGKL